MVRNWYGDCRIGKSLLHDDMAPSLTHFHEPVTHEYGADLLSGENTELTQRQSRLGSHTLPRANAA